MYCIKCGAHLADTETQCPLCQTKVYHPDIPQPQAEPLYPKRRRKERKEYSYWVQAIITAAFLPPILFVLWRDLQVNAAITWSGYVIGAIFVSYVWFVFPFLLKKKNPMIILPCYFVSAGLYLFYLNFVTEGNWFLPFALPVVGAVGITVITAALLLRHLRGYKLFIFGGVVTSFGGIALLVEHLLVKVSLQAAFTGWSLYPFIGLVWLGGLLVFLGACRPARETLQRKSFIK